MSDYEIISQIIKEMDSNPSVEDIANSRILVENEDIHTTMDIVESLKAGEITGTAIVRWQDRISILEANVIDFLMQEEIESIDATTGENVMVKSIDIPEGSWRLYT